MIEHLLKGKPGFLPPGFLPGWLVGFGFVRWLAVAAGLLGSLPTFGADISALGVFKGPTHFQDSASAPTDPAAGFEFYSFVANTTEDGVIISFLTPPGGIVPTLLAPSGDDPLVLEARAQLSTQGQLDTQFPSGVYNFQMIEGDGGN